MKKNQPKRLHLGAFDRAIDGWVNTDITPHIYIPRIPMLPFLLYKIGKIDKARYEQHKKGVFKRLKFVDLTKKLPFIDNTFEAVFSSHVFEHLFLDEIERLANEILRIMIPGGVCRISVPDLGKIVATFKEEDPREFLTGIFETTTRKAVKNQHHSGFTGPFLKKLFLDAGFSEAKVCRFRQGKCPDITILDNRPDGSLFFEAVK